MDPGIEEELNWFAEDPVPLVKPQRVSGAQVKLFSVNKQTEKESSKKAEAAVTKSDKIKTKSRDHEDDEAPVEAKKSRNDDSFKYPSDLLGKVAKTPLEKLNFLEVRDKLMRINLEKAQTPTRQAAAMGVCPDMCPEKERILRDVRGIVSSHEAFPDTNQMDHSLAVKEYARSSADQDEPLPHELRPVPVLRMTMDYLIAKIMTKLDNNVTENRGNWYDFCWGRLRAIRKDIIQQQLCDMNTVAIVEECARFHICCFDRLWGSSKSIFDDKINSETLMNCLKSLMYMYEDLRKQRKSCKNEAEFRAYMILLKLHSGFVLSEFQQFPIELQKAAHVKEAVSIHTAYSHNMYSTYFSLLKKTTYLNACLMQRLFGHLRTSALEIIVKSHCQPNKNGKMSVAYLTQTLKFDLQTDCISFCLDFGLTLSSDGLNFNISRNDFCFPEAMFTETNPSSLVVNKRLPIAQSVLGHKEFPAIFKHTIHSSFTEDHLFKPSALDASDQEEKMLRDDAERSQILRRKLSGEKLPEFLDEVCVEKPPVSQTIDEETSNVSSSSLTPDLLYDDMSPDIPYVDSPDVPYVDSPDVPYVDNEEDLETPAAKEVLSSQEPSANIFYTTEPESSSKLTPHFNLRPENLDPGPFTDDDEDDDDDDDDGDEDYDSFTQDEPESPLKFVAPPLFSSKPAVGTPSLPLFSSPFTFNLGTQQSETFQKVSEPFKILAAQKSPPENQNKLTKLESHATYHKTKRENENKVLMEKLRKKLSEKMKYVQAKKYARLWKAKVEKIKKNRMNQPVPMCHVSVGEYLKLWGCTHRKYEGRTLDRLNKRKRTNLFVGALLHLDIIDKLDSKVMEVGTRVADILGSGSVRWAYRYGNISQPQPVFWKLVLSLPNRCPEGMVFPSKLRLWCQTAFHFKIAEGDRSDICCRTTSSGVPVFIHPVITEGASEIETRGQNMSAAILILTDGWEPIEETQERLKTLAATAAGHVDLAVLTLGNKVVPIDENPFPDKLSIVHSGFWNETNAFVTSLLKLAQNHRMENLKVQSLGLLCEITIEKFLDALHQDQYLNDDLCDLLVEPNSIIQLYNALIHRLEAEIFHSCFYNYYGLACELEPVVKRLKCSYDIFPSNYRDSSAFKTALRSYTENLLLKTLNWDFKDSVELLEEFKGYCGKMGFPHLLSKLIRIINPPDSDSGEDLFACLKNIPWLPIVEMFAKSRIDRSAYLFKVVYREDRVKNLTVDHWWLKSLPKIFSKKNS